MVTHQLRAEERPSTRDTRNTRTRPALSQALLGLLEEKSFEQVTIREIANRAGVGYATFFRHYPDKEALLNDLAARQIRQLLSMTLPILYTIDSRSSSLALWAYVAQHKKLWAALLTGGAGATLKDEFMRLALQLAAGASTDNQTGIPNELLAIVPVAATVELLAWWLKQSSPPSIERMAEYHDLLVVSPSLKITNQAALAQSGELLARLTADRT